MQSKNFENIQLPLSIDNFRVHQQIGQGSQSRVYLCSNPLMNELISIKVYNSHQLYHAYQRQISFLKSISHPNIIRLISYNPQAIIKYDHGRSQIRQIAVLQFAYYGELLNIVNLNINLNQNACKYIFYQIILILKYLQNINIAHRDIKLQNILFDINFNIKLIDFGLATSLSSTIDNQKQSQYFQFEFYKPPQIYQCQYNCKKFDIFTAGFLLFYLLFNKAPFRSSKYSCPQYSYIRNNNSQAFWKFHFKHIKKNSQLLKNQSFKQLIFKLFNPNPQQRPSYTQILKNEWLTKQILNQQSARQQIKQKFIYLNNNYMERKIFYQNIQRLILDLKIQNHYQQLLTSQFQSMNILINPEL